MHRAGLRLLLLAPFAIACDWTAPAWPEGALLEVEPETSHSVRLSWPAALDDGRVDHYWISHDGVSAFRVDGSQTSTVVDDLEPTHPHEIHVVAVDEGGNRSVSLSGAGRALDAEPPQFEPDDRVNIDIEPAANDDRHTIARLSWPAATDDVGVAEYVVSDDSGVLARTRATAAALRRGSTNLTEVQVVAVDFAGNASRPLTTSRPEAPPQP